MKSSQKTLGQISGTLGSMKNRLNPGDVMVKIQMGLKRTAAGPNQLFFQNGPVQSHLFQTNY